jgi:hypothetical protein
MIVFSVTGPMTYLENVDIDNLAKAELGGCKGIALKMTGRFSPLLQKSTLLHNDRVFAWQFVGWKEFERVTTLNVE